MHHLLPIVPDFLARYPGLALDLSLTDTVVDLLEERADVAIRTGPLKQSRLVARKLGESRMIVVASPDYLQRHGEPLTPADLESHNRLGFRFLRHIEGWPFRGIGGGSIAVPPLGNALVGDGETLRNLVLAGLGIGRLAAFHVGPDIAAGRLVPLLEAYDAGVNEPVHAVYLGQGGHLPARVRAFLDFLVERVRLA
jgi:DNA-binding transcriptional LysR family regulator